MRFDLGLKGKTAIVTGASQGIGRVIAGALHAEGVAVALVARRREPLEKVVTSLLANQVTGAETGAYAIVADLGLETEVKRVAAEAIAQLGHVDILVNNAGRTYNGNIFKMSDDEIVQTWILKGLGYVRMVRELAPHFIKRRDGHIVNIAGSTGRMPTTDFIVGSMVNAAVVNFTRGISRELARYNVRVNSISPGWTLTDRQRRSFELRAAARKLSLDQVIATAAQVLPLGRLVEMEEIATLTLMLVSDRLPEMTGEDVAIDSGAGAALS